MPTGDDGQSRGVLPRLLSERAALAYFGCATAGVALIIASYFVDRPWLLYVGIVLVLPLVGWLAGMLLLALPVLVVLRGFSTRRDDGSLTQEKR